jgi:hypothetical protein
MPSQKCHLNQSRRRALLTIGSIVASSPTSILLEKSARAADGARSVERLDSADFAKDADGVRKLEGAIQKMMDRSRKNAKDPKGWLVNAKAHLDFCATPGTNGPNQVHFC